MRFTCWIILMVSLGISVNCRAQQDSLVRKGSYLYYGQPVIEDNSFLIEEAFNQSARHTQHINTFLLDDFRRGDFVYSSSHEIPLQDYHHQLSVTVQVPVLLHSRDYPVISPGSFSSTGIGDVYISYRPTIWGKHDWALVAPRVSLIIPVKRGASSGAFGGQFNLAVTKRASRSLVTHLNIGYTYLYHAGLYVRDAQGTYNRRQEGNLDALNVGGSLVWLAKDHFNLFLETVANVDEQFESDGSLTVEESWTLNPGFRCAVQIDNVQLVMGASMPLAMTSSGQHLLGGLLYVSLETHHQEVKD